MADEVKGDEKIKALQTIFSFGRFDKDGNINAVTDDDKDSLKVFNVGQLGENQKVNIKDVLQELSATDLKDFLSSYVLNAKREHVTPLIRATESGAFKLATFILDLGADPNQPSKDGKWTPAMGVLMARGEDGKEFTERILNSASLIKENSSGSSLLDIYGAFNYRVTFGSNVDPFQKEIRDHLKDHINPVMSVLYTTKQGIKATYKDSTLEKAVNYIGEKVNSFKEFVSEKVEPVSEFLNSLKDKVLLVSKRKHDQEAPQLGDVSKETQSLKTDIQSKNAPNAPLMEKVTGVEMKIEKPNLPKEVIEELKNVKLNISGASGKENEVSQKLADRVKSSHKIDGGRGV